VEETVKRWHLDLELSALAGGMPFVVHAGRTGEAACSYMAGGGVIGGRIGSGICEVIEA
jgi:hypothetical protein